LLLIKTVKILEVKVIMTSIKNVLAVIMAGGRGTRLYPLTQSRSKPDVPIGGKYRLIDIPISNCINSGIFRIAVLTQFNSASLHRHIANAYNHVFHGSLQILAASLTYESEDWYQGTADALRKQLHEIQNEQAEYILILAGDHLYQMDYEEMLNFHLDKKADVTVAVHPVERSLVPGLGILKCDASGRIASFIEKAIDPTIQERFICLDDPFRPFLASMGIYMFNKKMLIDLLAANPQFVDFGSDVIPAAIRSHSVYGFEFNGYWQDIGTVRAYYEASMAFTAPDSPFCFYSADFPIYSSNLSVPSSIITNSELNEVILGEGCQISGAKIVHSVVGLQSRISPGTIIKNSVIMGLDHCSSEMNLSAIPVGIGMNCYIDGTIVDENARVGKNVAIRPFPPGTEQNYGNWYVHDGIVVIPKDSEIPDNTIIGPEMLTFSQYEIREKVLPQQMGIATGMGRVGKRAK
jgi:glucose-1-phosphate adenylyltransferase